MFSSNPWNWLTLLASGLVLVGYSSADAGLLPAETATNTCPAIMQVAASPMKASIGDDIDVSVDAADEDGESAGSAWALAGSNRRHPPCKSGALPAELIARPCDRPGPNSPAARNIVSPISALTG